MKIIRWLLILMMFVSSFAIAKQKVIEKAVEAEKVVYFIDENTGTGRIVAFPCASCASLSLAFYKNILVTKNGKIIDFLSLVKYSGYSATIFYIEKDSTAVRLSIGERSGINRRGQL